LSQVPFEPVAAIIISCAGRKSVLKEGLELEPQEVLKGAPGMQALVGYPSFGEIGPLKSANGYDESIFHNMTTIVLTIGLDDNEE